MSIAPNRAGNRCVGSFICRQCHLGGDTLSFAIDVLGWECVDAFKQIEHQESTGIHLRKRDPEPTDVEMPSPFWMNEIEAMYPVFEQHIAQRGEVMRWLEDRGLPKEAVDAYRIGYNPSYQRHATKILGTDRDVHMPKGIVLPYMVDGQIRRVKIRRDSYRHDDKFSKYVGVIGSQKSMSYYPGTTNRMIVVESELDAMAIDYISKGRLHVVATGSNTRRPDRITHEAARDCSLIAIAYDNDPEGRKMLARWQEFYHTCIKYPVQEGKDVGEAFERGWDVKEWIEKLLV